MLRLIRRLRRPRPIPNYATEQTVEDLVQGTWKSRMKRSLSALSLITLGAIIATCAQRNATPGPSALHDAASTIERAISPAPAFASSSASGKAVTIADVAEKAVGGVVNISATRVVKQDPRQLGPFSRDPFFRDFFGGNPFESIPKERRQNSLGSGVIVSADGVVLTNNHVIQNAEDVRVTLADGRELGADIVGTDPKSDVAVLRLQGSPDNLRPLAFGDSSALRLGDVVIAIGNPFGVGQTVTMGIVSALGRGNVGIVDYEDFIQTDAAINPGNSGGALVNMRGELVGINTAILSRSGGNQGVGFAIPSSLARPTMESLLQDGKVVRGWLGVGIQDLDDDLADALGLSIKDGVLISDVAEGSPADKAGLQRGDVVVALDGAPMKSTSKLRNRVALAGPGKTVALDIVRKGKKKTLKVSLGELPGELAGGSSSPSNAPGESDFLGVSVSGIDAAARRRFGLEDDVKSGVVITGVQGQSRAARAGLRPGDVIEEVDRTPVKGPAHFQSLVGESESRVLLLVNRKGTTLYVAIGK